nr:glycosyltransferase [Halomonas socia]
MKVFFICSSFGGGGAEKVAVKLSGALAAFGHDVSYIYWKSKEGQEYELHGNVKTKKISTNKTFLRAFEVSRIIKNERPDVILSFTDLPNIITYFACLLTWPYKCLRVPNVRTNVSAKYRHMKSTLVTKILSSLHGLSCRSAPIVLVNSKDSGSALCEYYRLDASKVHCIYNPVFDTLPSELYNSDNGVICSNKKVKAVNVGRLSQAKDQHMLVRAIDHAVNTLGADVELDIYGEGELYDELHSEIAHRGLQDRIFLRPFDPNIESKIGGYHLFLFSSRWEGLPNALIEALGSGIDVISTDCRSGPSEILDGGRFGTLVGIGDDKEMAEAIARLYFEGNCNSSSNSCAREMSDDLKKHLEQFTISFVTSQYAQLISRNINEQ